MWDLKMSKSYEEINYFLRIKKQIERKIIIEALQHLDIKVSGYHYVGMGSIYFVDFVLFHKYLNIKLLTSIDDKAEDETRFKFNRPFGFIDFHVKNINYYIQNLLDWQTKLFLWLDYDNEIDKDKLEAIEYVASKAKPNDLLLITVAANTPEVPESFLKIFKDFLPPNYSLKEIKSSFPETINKILCTVFSKGMNTQTKEIAFLPIFNYSYRDGNKMYTYGGIFCEPAMSDVYKNKLSSLPFISLDNRIIKIDCPLITHKEKMALDSAIQKNGELDNFAKTTGIREEKLNRYKAYYKFYPQFFESIY